MEEQIKGVTPYTMTLQDVEALTKAINLITENQISILKILKIEPLSKEEKQRQQKATENYNKLTTEQKEQTPAILTLNDTETITKNITKLWDSVNILADRVLTISKLLKLEDLAEPVEEQKKEGGANDKN